jgi:hypothetical protein
MVIWTMRGKGVGAVKAFEPSKGMLSLYFEP